MAQEVQASVGSQRTRKHRMIIFVVISTVNLVLFLLFCKLLLTPAQIQHQADTQASNTTSLGDIYSPLIGKPAPDFTLSLLNGSKNSVSINLAAFKGRAVILNFWASWCTPCNDEAVFLRTSWPALKSRGIQLIGVDAAENMDNALKFIRQYALPYPNVQDTITAMTASAYGVNGLPETIFIDRNGIVVATWISVLDQQGLQLEVAKLAH